MRFLALDFETTGVVKGYPNEPWQLGVVAFEDGRLISSSAREWFFNPGERPFSPRAGGRWRDLKSQLALAPTFVESLAEVITALSGMRLVAHNVAAERTILTKVAPLTQFGPWIDTLTLTRALYPSISDHALGSLIGSLGLKTELDEACPGRTWHDALYDAYACALIGCHFMRRNLWFAGKELL